MADAALVEEKCAFCAGGLLWVGRVRLNVRRVS